ncbi:MAG: hypothetical protein RLZZ292_3077, partial [Bacteroidota bacterium]
GTLGTAATFFEEKINKKIQKKVNKTIQK